jgi:hypothetical protein
LQHVFGTDLSVAEGKYIEVCTAYLFMLMGSKYTEYLEMM